MPDDIILSVDPGREKCGLAVAGKTMSVFFKTIVNTNYLRETAEKLAEEYSLSAIVLGDRTSSAAAKNILTGLESNGLLIPVILTDEHHSSEEARLRYWQDNPPKGLWRLLPLTMQTPPVPIDDYVALILAERYFKSL